MTKDQKITEIFYNILDELDRADAKYGHDPMVVDDRRTALNTIMCEVAELEREVDRKTLNPVWLRKEAVQVAAMAVKFLRDAI
jgi:hypothetical protein